MSRAIGHGGPMNDSSAWRLLVTAFVSVFVAELGDKTQLATFALSSGAASTVARLSVFVGASLALVATSAIGVVGGAWMGRIVSPVVLQRGAGALFVALGVWMLVRRAS
jgi:Ca2+/H+ antiporter, TMEM165/GDT1 family